jgi:AcrR family transcriptional regulator
VDAEGLDALSMRRLGAELGVNPMAAYHHIPNKDALLDAIVEAVMSDVSMHVLGPGACLEDYIVAAAIAYRDALLAHPNALPAILVRSPQTPEATRPVEVLLGLLTTAGLSPAHALAGMNVIAATVRGMVATVASPQSSSNAADDDLTVLERLPRDEFPILRAALSKPSDFLGADFEFGIRALAMGLVEQGRSRRSTK